MVGLPGKSGGAVRIELRVQYLAVRRAFVVVLFAVGSIGPVGAFSSFVSGCGGEVLGDGEGKNQDGTIDGDSGKQADRREAGVTLDGCPEGLPGPELIPLIENGGLPYCVDSTEVTNAQYQSFVAANVAASSQASICSQNSSFLPLFGWPAASADADRPVVNIDWCDARAFCTWAGKKLCGAPGGTSGPAHDDKNADTSLLYAACSNLGARVFPYGDTYQPSTCNGADNDIAATLDVNLPATCTDSSSRIFGSSGNVWEWEDACESNDPLARCRLRGGSFRSNADSLDCAASDLAARNSAFDDFGFRCCAE